mmetsp:Transcript_10432/g.23117  ORF Transcript_10432/g.23117 Transcript_10432/m.23117 type:complete len:383 (-) Transcript_10432:439-1587(-)
MREASEVRKQGPDSSDEPAVSLQHALLHLLHIEGQCVLVHVLHVYEEGGPGAVQGRGAGGRVGASTLHHGHLQGLFLPEGGQIHAHALRRGAAGAGLVQVGDAEVAAVLLVPGVHAAADGVPHSGLVHDAVLVQGGGDGTRVGGNIPHERGHDILVQQSLHKGAYCRHSLDDARGQGVLGVGDDDEVLGAGHGGPPVVGVVGLLELIHGGVNHHLGHGESLLVEEGVHLLLQQHHVGVVEAHSEVHLRVVLEGVGPAAVAAVLVVLHLHEVDRVQHNRHNGRHTARLVNCPHIPRGPASLGGAGDRVVVQRQVLLGEFRLHEGSDGVHRAQGGLDHGEAQQPLGLGGVLDEVVPGEGDDGVLSAGLLDRVRREGHVLVGDLE